MKNPSILFIGAGRMAEAIISGLHKKSKDQIDKVYVANRRDTKRLQILSDLYGVVQTKEWKDTLSKVEIIVLAMPPEAHEIVLNQLKDIVTNQFILTIAAGIDPSYLESILPSKIPVGWIMPNTAAQIGHSISLYTYGKAVTDSNKKQMDLIVNAIGHSQQCTEEEIHRLTAITGSAPAFIYQFVESLIGVTEKLGVSHNISQKLVTEMVIGTAEMLKTGKTPKELREQVTTPGGATAEGLAVLKANGMEEIIQNAVIATNKKARDSN